MIIELSSDGLYAVTLAYLVPNDTQDTDLPRCFSTSEQLTAYLKNRPFKHFILRSHQLGEKLPEVTDNIFKVYGEEFGDIFITENIFYNPNTDSVSSVIPGPGGIWSG